ncbi:cytochrome c oxidase assembly protein COX11, mitochondrial-like [Argonauta hians]
MWNLSSIFPCLRIINRTCHSSCWKANRKLFSHHYVYNNKEHLLQHSVRTAAVRTYVSLIVRGQNKNSLNSSRLSRTFLKKGHKAIVSRPASTRQSAADAYRKRTILIYICSVGIFMVGMSYAGVPLYRMFCQATGLGGQAVAGHDTSRVENMNKVSNRSILVRFNADVSSSMQWNFRPHQPSVKVLPGETALAFYSAKNPTDKPIIGISTYNIVPYEAAMYFNKIQCFCFEEQRLNPHEQVDMPVFFYIDPDFVEDPKLQNVDTITLSYTFFEAKDGLKLPMPSYITS